MGQRAGSDSMRSFWQSRFQIPGDPSQESGSPVEDQNELSHSMPSCQDPRLSGTPPIPFKDGKMAQNPKEMSGFTEWECEESIDSHP